MIIIIIIYRISLHDPAHQRWFGALAQPICGELAQEHVRSVMSPDYALVLNLHLSGEPGKIYIITTCTSEGTLESIS